VSCGTDEHELQSAGGNEDGQGCISIRVEQEPLSGLRDARPVRGQGAVTSDAGRGGTSRRATSPTAGAEDGGLPG